MKTELISSVTIPDFHRVHPSGAWVRTQMTGETHYDAAYIRTRYDRPGVDCAAMSALRWANLCEHCDTLARVPFRILDFGSGNGAFLKHVAALRPGTTELYSYDVADYPIEVPTAAMGVMKRVPRCEPALLDLDLLTCFDSLEHVRDADEFMSLVRARHVCLSLPWCHGMTRGADWYAGWRHNRPTEHWWNFDAASLALFMAGHGYRTVFVGNPEDRIRRGPDNLPNILTGIFERTDWKRN